MAIDSEQRPWGSWHVIDVADGYKIKRIHVNPGSRLSLQSHEHRSEHWVVIQGEATCEINGVESVVKHDESTGEIETRNSRYTLVGEAQ